MQLPTQLEFVRKCMDKYFFTDIPPGQKWEEAHFPLPECLGGDDTVMLWSADHVVQGLLQSVELDHRCFHTYRNEFDIFNLTQYYPEYLGLFKELKFKFSRRQGKKAAELGVGIHGQSASQMTANGKKAAATNKANSTAFYDPKIQSAAGIKSTAINKASGTGIFAPGMQSVNGKKGGEISGKKASAITNTQRWQCLVTDHISNSGGLARYQQARGIDTSLRIQL